MKIRPSCRALAVVSLALGLAGAARAQPEGTIQVSGAVAVPGAWTVARLKQQFGTEIQPITYTVKGVTHTAHALSLLSLIRAAQPRINPHIKNHSLQFLIAVQGHDGYTVDFSYAEMLPEIGNRAVWVALDEDGKLLTPDSGPVQLVVPGDVKPGRWVHAVTAVIVADGVQTIAPARP